MSDIQIGVTNFERKGPRNPTFYIKPGSNFYRVLPPMHSLASLGRYAQYHATHRVLTSEGRTIKFRCIEVKDNQTKAITQRCPLCDLTAEKRAQYETAKQSGATWEQLKEFNDSQVFPIAAEKKYFVNAIDQENQVALLCLPYTAFKDLDNELKKIKTSKGIDGTSLQNGIFFNFEREGQGFNTKYKVTSMKESVQTEQGVFEKDKAHVVTEEVMEQIKIHSRDLGTLFREVSYDDIDALAKSDNEGRKLIADRLLPRSDKTEKTNNIIESSAPGFGGVTAVNKIEVGAQGTTLAGPFVEQPVQQSTTPVQQTVSQDVQVGQPVQQSTTPVQQPVTAMPPTNDMTDEQFNAMFMQNSGTK